MRITLLILCLCLQTACSKNTDDTVDIGLFYQDIESFNTRANITSNLGDNIIIYDVEFTYNFQGEDTLKILAPEEISGITAFISNDKNISTITYEDMSLETTLPDISGFTPLDALTVLTDNLKFSHAEVLELNENSMFIRYIGENEQGEWIKDVTLNQEFKLLKAEFFLDGQMLLNIKFDNFTFLESINNE